MAMALIFQEYLDTNLSKNHDSDIGIYLEFDPGFIKELIHSEYAVHESMVMNKVAALFLNVWTLKQTENYSNRYSNDC